MPVKDVRDKIRERNARLRKDRDGHDVPVEGNSALGGMAPHTVVVDDPHVPSPPSQAEVDLFTALEALVDVDPKDRAARLAAVGNARNVLDKYRR